MCSFFPTKSYSCAYISGKGKKGRKGSIKSHLFLTKQSIENVLYIHDKDNLK